MLILGIVLCVIGFLLLISFLLSIIRCKTKTEAVIVRIIEKKRYFRGRTIKECTPVFAYTVNNVEYTAKADFSTTNANKFFVGQKLIVFTDINHPEKMRYGSNIGFCIAGIVFALLGIFIVILFFM